MQWSKCLFPFKLKPKIGRGICFDHIFHKFYNTTVDLKMYQLFSSNLCCKIHVYLLL